MPTDICLSKKLISLVEFGDSFGWCHICKQSPKSFILVFGSSEPKSLKISSSQRSKGSGIREELGETGIVIEIPREAFLYGQKAGLLMVGKQLPDPRK